MKKIAAILLAVFSSVASADHHWFKVADGKDGAQAYISLESLNSRNKLRDGVWFKIEKKERDFIGAELILFKISSCKKGATAFQMEQIIYTVPDFGNKPIRNTNVYPLDEKKSEQVRQIICTYK